VTMMHDEQVDGILVEDGEAILSMWAGDPDYDLRIAHVHYLHSRMRWLRGDDPAVVSFVLLTSDGEVELVYNMSPERWLVQGVADGLAVFFSVLRVTKLAKYIAARHQLDLTTYENIYTGEAVRPHRYHPMDQLIDEADVLGSALLGVKRLGHAVDDWEAVWRWLPEGYFRVDEHGSPVGDRLFDRQLHRSELRPIW
jgi:hypothetical protein